MSEPTLPVHDTELMAAHEGRPTVAEQSRSLPGEFSHLPGPGHHILAGLRK